MRRIALIDRAERRRLEKIVQRSKDKRFSRRANAILLIHSGQSRKRVAMLLSAARSSVNRWCKWYEESGVEGLKDAVHGKLASLPSDVIVRLLCFLIPCSHSGAKREILFSGSVTNTGKATYVGRQSKCSQLFIQLMEHLRNTYREAKSRKTQAWLKQNPKFTLLFQSVYSPWVNKTEKLWHASHETVTRNHKCSEM